MFRMKGKDDPKAKKPEDNKDDKKPVAKSDKPSDKKAPAAGPKKPAGPPVEADLPVDEGMGDPALEVAPEGLLEAPTGTPEALPDPGAAMALPMAGGLGADSAFSHIGKVNPAVAGYLPPEEGPFLCGRCSHFDGQGGCDIVSGEIHADGVCNLFENNFNGSDLAGGADLGMGAEEPLDAGQIDGAAPGPPIQA